MALRAVLQKACNCWFFVDFEEIALIPGRSCAMFLPLRAGLNVGNS
jgi:hypothetical protein